MIMTPRTPLALADRMGRLGTETAFDVLARAAALAQQGHDIINLGIGQPDFKTPHHIVQAGIQALKDGHHGYTAANGIPALRDAVAADVQKRLNVDVDADQVVIVPGGKPTMFFAALMFGQAGVEIMYPNPGFPIYESAIRFAGATPVPIELNEQNGFAFSADAVLSRITNRTRLIIINSPANPTGGVTPKAEIDRLVAGLEQHPQVAVLSDEIYSQMLYDGQEHTSLLHYPSVRDRVIILDGWSKTYAMTGWRLGYAIWPQALVEAVTRLCINDHSCVNATAQYAGIAALTGAQDAVQAMMAEFATRRRVIVDGLNALSGVRCGIPRGAFYAFANIKDTGMTAAKAQDLFLNKAGVATVAGTSFGKYGEGFVRFSYANSKENIERALERIAQVLRG